MSDIAWVSASHGGGYTAAVKTDGTLRASGLSVYGELGDKTTINSSMPVQVGTHAGKAAVSVPSSAQLPRL